MDFPIVDLLDPAACYRFLVELLHPDGLRCPQLRPQILQPPLFHPQRRLPPLQHPLQSKLEPRHPNAP